MSYGRPPNVESSPGKAPLLGSFPLDHDGECKISMKEYVKCLKQNKSNNGLCREFSQAYLQCRMDNGLMEPEDMKNLGFADLKKSKQQEPTS
ncbi:hypothetical protein EDC94DRAFT_605907 [Helicostylum pulchrum]|nr:hypothetical protein EDC94DRAFT_605907 [Helicostylum pulchrum]